MTNVISIKPNIIIPNQDEVDFVNLKKEAHEFIDEVEPTQLLILAMDRDNNINRMWKNMTYPDLIYHLDRARHNFMKDIDEYNS